MTEILSLWRSPLDQVAVSKANNLRDRQPYCSIGYGENFDAMTIYNYGYYISLPKSPNDALTQMFMDMSAASPVGGTAFISQTTLASPLNSSTSGFAVPDQCNIIGSAGGGVLVGTGPPNQFFHFTIDFTNHGIFLNCSGNSTSGGKYFHSLAFKGTFAGVGDTCINAATDNCRAVNCTFTDVPTAFYATGNGCTLEQCTINYDTVNGATAIRIAGSQCGVFGPADMDQQKRDQGGPKDCTAVSIEGAQQTVIADVHLSDWFIGVDFSAVAGGAQDTEIRNAEIQSWQYALKIQLPSTAATTRGIKITSCMLAKTGGSTDTHPIVSIDPGTGNSNAQLSDIALLDCTVFSGAVSANAQYGVQIAGGTNIRIIGGVYSNNGSMGGAGIAVTGACGDVQIIAANLQSSYPWAGTVLNLNHQQYGLLVTSAPASTGTILVKDCDLYGYDPMMSQQAVHVTVPVTRGLFIENCRGYNDVNTSLNMGAAPTVPTNAAGCSTPYFGPSVIAFSSSTPVHLTIFGQTFTLSYGVFYLPSPYDTISFDMAPTAGFSWYGK